MSTPLAMKLFLLSSPPRRVAVFFAFFSIPALSFAASLDGPGIPNFHQVNGKVYRGAQPTEEGFASLAKLGVKTVVDLRLLGEHSQAEEQEWVEARGMHYVSIPMRGMSTPTNEQVARVVALFEDVASGPVFVHCRRGADRTGAVIAAYRIEHDHWDNEKALSEARSWGMSWFEKAIQHYVRTFQPSQLALVARPAVEKIAEAAAPATEKITEAAPSIALR